MRAVVLAPLLGALGVLASVRLATAQCPDGTPPPCAAARASPRPPSLAVLFMELRSRTADDSLLAEGLTLEIINTLGGVERLDVRSRWVSRRIAADADPARTARALGVDYLVDGVLEVDSARVLVRGALTRTATGRVVRPLRIERRRVELERLQREVAAEVASAVVGQLLPAEQARFAVRREDPRVTELLLRAMALAEQYTAATYRQAIGLVGQAIAVDASSSRAWATLAWCYFLLKDFGLGLESTDSLEDRGKAAAERALTLDSANAYALVTLAAFRAIQNDVSPATEALARRGALLQPDSWTRGMLAWVLQIRGREEEAVAVVQQVVRLDSLSPAAWADAGWILGRARRHGEAAGAWERALALRPSSHDSAQLRVSRHWGLLEAGNCAGALAAGRAAHERVLVIESLRCLGRATEADSLADDRLARPISDPDTRAFFLALKGQPDSAFAVLDRAFPRYLGFTLLNPAFDPYRQHRAYRSLRRRMGLAQ